ncbi:MAG: hypothetical protein IKP40_01895 [Clostridia bacterium]|nr:hypothetical protein [Clostridia bacterium]
MKYIALLLVFLLLASLAGIGYLYVSSTFSVSQVTCEALEASAQPQFFASTKLQLEEHALVGTVFSDTVPGDAADYQFITYTVRLMNSTAVNADMVEVQITPMAGDICQIGSTRAMALQGRSEGDISVTMLTGIAMHPVRELTVTYYLWGIPFTLKTAYGR